MSKRGDKKMGREQARQQQRCGWGGGGGGGGGGAAGAGQAKGSGERESKRDRLTGRCFCGIHLEKRVFFCYFPNTQVLILQQENLFNKNYFHIKLLSSSDFHVWTHHVD